MPFFIVELARTVRETKQVEVEASTEDAIDLDSVYDQDDGTGFEADQEWGCEAGTHVVIGPALPNTPEIVATDIDLVATNWNDRHKGTWPDNESMLLTGAQDAEDLRKVAGLVRENKFRDAAIYGRGLDTIVRETLPESFYKLLERNKVKPHSAGRE